MDKRHGQITEPNGPLLRTPAALLDPARLDVETVETHVSTLAFVGDQVHKRKKHVKFAFVDQSTPERREALCRREVDLNRRFSPDVYLGVEEIVDGEDQVVDHAVLMRRMPEERRLATLVRSGTNVAMCLDAVAETVALRHLDSARSPEISSVAEPLAIRSLWDQNLTEMASFVPRMLTPESLGTIGTLAHRYVDGRDRLLTDRIEQGKIVDGHGDLLADDIFCLDDGPRILDCLEFDDRLRWGDVMLDIGFLAMDLERLGRPDLARHFLDRYAQLTGDLHPRSLEDHYVAYRALVRAKVSCLKGSVADQIEANQYIRQCLRHLRDGRVRLAVIGGLPGTGKTTLAVGLSRELGWSVLRSDEVRKALVGLDPLTRAGAPYGTGLYDPSMTLRTYHQLFTLAGSLLERGENVIIDASMGRVAWRQAATEIAREHFADLIELRCVLPTAVAERRLIERMVAGTDASDADVDIASRMASDFDEWPEAIVVDTLPLADEVVRTTIHDLVPSSTIASIGSTVASNSAAPPSAR